MLRPDATSSVGLKLMHPDAMSSVRLKLTHPNAVSSGSRLHKLYRKIIYILLLHSSMKAAMCGLRLVQPSMWGFEAGVTSQGSSGGLGSLVVKAPFMKWGNSGFESTYASRGLPIITGNFEYLFGVS